MANYPLEGKTFIKSLAYWYYDIDFNSVYYLCLHNKLVAVKPLVGHFKSDGPTTDSFVIDCITASGETYSYEPGHGNAIYKSVDEYLEHAANGKCPERLNSNCVFRLLQDDKRLVWDGPYYIVQYVWENGKPQAYRGYINFWTDIDGPHWEFAEKLYGKKAYLSAEECLKENFEVMEFDNVPKPKGEYTVTHKFTVKATSEEEAQRIFDEAIANIRL